MLYSGAVSFSKVRAIVFSWSWILGESAVIDDSGTSLWILALIFWIMLISSSYLVIFCIRKCTIEIVMLNIDCFRISSSNLILRISKTFITLSEAKTITQAFWSSLLGFFWFLKQISMAWVNNYIKTSIFKLSLIL